MLRINGTPVEVADGELVAAPDLLEDRTDTFEFAAGLDTDVTLTVDGGPLPVARDYRDPGTVCWTWAKGPAGRVGYARLELRVGGDVIASGALRVQPRKLSLDDYAAILDDISSTAYNIVYDLRNTTFEHLDLVEPGQVPKSGVEWLESIRVFMTPLAEALVAINQQPHVRLNHREEDRYVWELRHHGPSFIGRVLRASATELVIDKASRVPSLSGRMKGRVPVRLPEDICEPDTNTYENRLVAQFLTSLEEKLRDVQYSAADADERLLASNLIRDVEPLRSLSFLAGVEPLFEPPRVTLVLLRNFRYRQFYEIFRRFHWALRIHYGDAEASDLLRLTTQKVWETYQAWTFFKVVEAVELATGGRPTLAQNIVEVLDYDKLIVRVGDGSKVEIKTEDDTIAVAYKPYFASGSGPRPYSVGYGKEPDITVESRRTGAALIFDAKYRLDSEAAKLRPDSETAVPAIEPTGPATPKPDDIDKMHAYRDALRVGNREPYTMAAYVLYPGTERVLLDEGRIGAIPLLPSHSLQPVVERVRMALGITGP